MKAIYMYIVASASVGFGINAIAADPMFGEKRDGGIFLYRERLEIYWNDWIAYPQAPTETRNAQIRGEGKTKSFAGNLSMDCQAKKYKWSGVKNFDEMVTPESGGAISIVPREVVQNAGRLLCSGAKR